MGKRGPPYKPPDDAQWIVVLKPPHVQSNGQIDYTPLEYWLRAILGDQRVAKFVYEIQKRPDLAVIVELPSPHELPFPKAAYGIHDLRLGLKRRPWFSHATGKTVILPYNFEHVGHPEDTRKLHPMISGDCEDEWLKFDLTIPYPIPQPYDFVSVPQGVRMFCRRPPAVTPPPPDSMEIDRYPTPPTQELQRAQNFHQASQPRNEQPLFIPEDDSVKPKIKNLDPYQEEESTSSFLRGTSSTVDASGLDVKPEPRLISVAERPTPLNANENHRESNALSFRGDSRSTADSDEPDNNPLSVKREFANQDDTESQRMHQLLQAVNRSQSPSEDDRLSVKRELENQDGVNAQRMFKVLDAVNRGQSTRVDGPGGGMIKRDPEARDVEHGEYNPSRNTRSGNGSRTTSPPNSNLSSWRDRDERGGRERGRERDDRARRRDGERGWEPADGGGGDRKRSLAHPDGRNDRGSSDRGECKRLPVPSYLSICSSTQPLSPPSPIFSTDPKTFFSPLFTSSLSGVPRRNRRIPRRRFRDSGIPHISIRRLSHSKKIIPLRVCHTDPSHVLFSLKPKEAESADPLTSLTKLGSVNPFGCRQTPKSEPPMNHMIP